MLPPRPRGAGLFDALPGACRSSCSAMRPRRPHRAPRHHRLTAIHRRPDFNLTTPLRRSAVTRP
ncbi:MAG: hypothetical protein M5R42_01500 [Rhodocyclaceae bacterium]|nr:hypothetical protein [Rhodocyclaceae bacterium]